MVDYRQLVHVRLIAIVRLIFQRFGEDLVAVADVVAEVLMMVVVADAVVRTRPRVLMKPAPSVSLYI